MPPSPPDGSSAALTLADFTSPGLIVPKLRNRDLETVIQELSQMMEREGRVPDLLSFFRAALERESVATTDMEAGIAFPHARLSGLNTVSFALGRSNEPLNWGASARAVRLVFLIAVPATDVTQYLPLISGLAHLAKDSGLMERLYAAPDAGGMFEALGQIRLRTNATPEKLKQAPG